MGITFDATFERLLGHEGGYSNDPKDPGGETNWGISKRSYPNVDIKALSKESAKAIYKKDFWDALGADTLPSSVVFQLFDFAVNSGIQTAIRKLQKVVGVADDGHWGPASAAAAQKTSEADMLMGLIGERLNFMTDLANWQTYGRGWAKRIAQDLKYATMDNKDAPWTL